MVYMHMHLSTCDLHGCVRVCMMWVCILVVTTNGMCMCVKCLRCVNRRECATRNVRARVCANLIYMMRSR